MDPTKIEKLQATKRYKNTRRRQLLPTLTLYLVTTFLLLLLLSSPIWAPCLCSFLQVFFLVSLPDIGTALLSPKCLFVVCNLIVAFLVRESRLRRPGACPAHGIYEEYVKRNAGCHRSPATGVTKTSSAVDEALDGGGEWEEEVMKGEEEEEDLHKRVEDFIAMVKKERSLEAKMLLCY